MVIMRMMMIMITIMSDSVLQNANRFFSDEGGRGRRTRVKMWSSKKVKKVQTEEATPGKCKKIQAQKYGVIKSTKVEEASRDKSNVCTCLFLLSAGMDQCCHVAKTWPS